MPSEEPDPAEYLIGGCLVSEDMPDYRCITCSTNFYRGSRNHHPFVSDGSEGEVSDGEEYFDEQD